MCTDYFDRSAMASSASSGVYDDHTYMDISSDGEPLVEIVSFDDEDLDDFQPFTLPDPVHDREPLVDDVLAVGPQLNQFIIIGHPDGAHIVDYIPLDVIPLPAVLRDMVVSDNDDDVPVIHVGHPDDDIGDGEVHNIAILEVSSPVVSVIDISSSDGRFDTSPSEIRRAGLRADPTDSSFDTIPIVTPPPDDTHVPVSTPVDPLPVAPLDTHTSHPTPTTLAPGCPLPPHTADSHQFDLPTIFPHEIPAPRPGEGTSGQPPSFDPLASVGFMPTPHFSPFEADPYCQSPRWFPPYSMPLSDPYHPSHHTGYTHDDLLLSLQLQSQILSRRVLELECEADARQPPPPSYPPPVTPPPPSFPPPVFPSSAPVSIEGFNARFLTVEQQISFLVRRVHELEDELTHLHSLIFPTPPPPPAL
ncbi:hypothetical protein HanOQP8_Chr16g0610631 [Helianthus annuus]|nr:hypothetical protein HanIR_Chr16g0805091 [Helianthus annuus]KAJ0640367.1 hypothetical protein HanLR1_Chr16g0614651 [Helianthus annuus]KAJ0644312.1 hypothetical protein HanOQP8_Chr16g0610631 [Helianthus annuus]KAJ0820610.1 hypothetical protein HanPSC8_Chr16g0710061 [Helianthus annuus]